MFTGPVEEHKKLIEDWHPAHSGSNRTYGISSKAGHRWMQRFLADWTHTRRNRGARSGRDGVAAGMAAARWAAAIPAALDIANV